MVKVITYGTFDLFHEGHYRLLRRAKQLGDYLIVGVTSDEFDRARGKLNVVDSLVTRIENVKKTGFADKIIVEESAGQKFKDIQKYNIDIFTLGSDWAGKFDFLEDYCKVVYLERTKDVSSTLLRVKDTPIQRIGIIGTGRIAGRFMPEARLVNGAIVHGVYNPHVESAKLFANIWEINPYESLEDFFEAIDSVYIASPHETHYEYIKASLEHGKHVLCEKPMVLEKAQAEEVFALAKQKGLVLMEGIKTAYAPCFTKLLGVAYNGEIGAIKNVEACFTKLENPSNRELVDVKYGGSFTELASYCLLPIVKAFGTELGDVRFDSIKDSKGIDLFTRATFKCQGGLGTATCGLGVKSDGRLLISGTKGYIVVDAPWWKLDYFEVRHEDPNKIEKYSDSFLGSGLRYELYDFLSMVNGSSESGYKLTAEESIAIAGVMERFMRENGRV